MQSGQILNSKAVVLTTGTFLGGQCYIGKEMYPAGRFMRQNQSTDIKIEPASNDLAEFLRAKFPIGRLRTGTPPRLNRKTIDYSNLAIQASDVQPHWFSFKN